MLLKEVVKLGHQLDDLSGNYLVLELNTRGAWPAHMISITLSEIKDVP